MATHRKRVKHFHDPGDFHELTFSCYQRRPLLTNDQWRTYLTDSIDQAGEQFNFSLIAYVFMPEHVHLLVLPHDDQPAIDRYLAAIKRPTSVRVKDDLTATGSRLLHRLTIQERPGKTVFRYWQEGPGYDRNLRTEQAVLNVIAYLHANPVRRGLCRQPIEWPWSSARWFASERPAITTIGPRLTPLPAEFGWRLQS